MIDTQNNGIEIIASDSVDGGEGDGTSTPLLQGQNFSKIGGKVPTEAGFWIRLLAFEIDLFILTVGGLGLSEVLYKGLLFFNLGHVIVPASIALFSVIGICYFGFFESSTWKSTPGKRFLGLRVTTMRGKRIEQSTAFARTITSCICAIPAMAGFFAVLFTRKKQAWHDLSAKTLVLRKPGETVLPDSLVTWESSLIRIAALVFFAPMAISAINTSNGIISPLLIDHHRRDRIDTAIVAVKPIQAAIQAGVKADKAYPKKIENSVFKAAAEEAKAIVAYNPKNGVLTLQFSNQKSGKLAIVSLYPMPAANGDFQWNCSAYGIEDKVLPKECKTNKS